MCDGMPDEKILVYKVIDDETAPGGIAYKKPEDVIEHFQSWLENVGIGDDFKIKVIVEEMTESQFENLPEYK